MRTVTAAFGLGCILMAATAAFGQNAGLPCSRAIASNKEKCWQGSPPPDARHAKTAGAAIASGSIKPASPKKRVHAAKQR